MGGGGGGWAGWGLSGGAPRLGMRLGVLITRAAATSGAELRPGSRRPEAARDRTARRIHKAGADGAALRPVQPHRAVTIRLGPPVDGEHWAVSGSIAPGTHPSREAGARHWRCPAA